MTVNSCLGGWSPQERLFLPYMRMKEQVSQFKLWIGEVLGGNSISFVHGDSININNDGSMNKSISLEEHEGELKLKPMGMGMFAADMDKLMSPKEVADYLW